MNETAESLREEIEQQRRWFAAENRRYVEYERIAKAEIIELRQANAKLTGRLNAANAKIARMRRLASDMARI